MAKDLPIQNKLSSFTKINGLISYTNTYSRDEHLANRSSYLEKLQFGFLQW